MSNKRREYVEEHWQDMPEFKQEKKKEYQKLIVRFDNEEDVEEFSKLIGQKITPKTKSIWHPKLERGKDAELRYVDE